VRNYPSIVRHLIPTCIGHEIDLRMVYQLTEQLELDVGYAHFMPGTFTTDAGGSDVDDSDFFYVQMTY
jgi:long-subunit fatty acid transport protein